MQKGQQRTATIALLEGQAFYYLSKSKPLPSYPAAIANPIKSPISRLPYSGVIFKVVKDRCMKVGSVTTVECVIGGVLFPTLMEFINIRNLQARIILTAVAAIFETDGQFY